MRRRFQFSLKTLFVAMFVFAVAFSLGLNFGRRMERERLEVERQSLAEQQARIEARVEEGANFRAFLIMEEEAGRLPKSSSLPRSFEALPGRSWP